LRDSPLFPLPGEGCVAQGMVAALGGPVGNRCARHTPRDLVDITTRLPYTSMPKTTASYQKHRQRHRYVWFSLERRCHFLSGSIRTAVWAILARAGRADMLRSLRVWQPLERCGFARYGKYPQVSSIQQDGLRRDIQGPFPFFAMPFFGPPDSRNPGDGVS
jgi:hypothetical protein